MQVALPLGPCDPADPMVLGVAVAVAVAERDAVQSIRWAPTGEIQPLGFWSEALPSSSNKYSS